MSAFLLQISFGRWWLRGRHLYRREQTNSANGRYPRVQHRCIFCNKEPHQVEYERRTSK